MKLTSSLVRQNISKEELVFDRTNLEVICVFYLFKPLRMKVSGRDKIQLEDGREAISIFDNMLVARQNAIELVWEAMAAEAAKGPELGQPTFTLLAQDMSNKLKELAQ